jgi:hypothetical protein
MVAALAIGMDAHFAGPIVETFAACEPGDARRMKGVLQIGGADFLESSRSGGPPFLLTMPSLVSGASS